MLPSPGKNFRRQEAIMPSHTQTGFKKFKKENLYKINIPVPFVQRRLAAPGLVYTHWGLSCTWASGHVYTSEACTVQKF
jgi:hypothetical protein